MAVVVVTFQAVSSCVPSRAPFAAVTLPANLLRGHQYISRSAAGSRRIVALVAGHQTVFCMAELRIGKPGNGDVRPLVLGKSQPLLVFPLCNVAVPASSSGVKEQHLQERGLVI